MSVEHLTTTQRSCPVCGGCQGFVIGQLTYALFDDLAMSGHKTLVQCCRCGMLYDDVTFSVNQLDDYYRRNAHYAASAIGGSGSMSDDNNARYDRIIDLLEPVRDGVILDFGCGQGGFLARCEERGLAAVGIESSDDSARAACKTGLHVYDSIGTFVTSLASCHVHAVVFSHVLEHLMDPRHYLQAAGHVAKDALVYIEVPDADNYLSLEAVRWQEMHFEHLSHFRQNNIIELARHASIAIRRYGKTSFSQANSEVHCHFIIGRFVSQQETTQPPAVPLGKYDPMRQLPALSIDNLPPDDHPFALWGVSQHAMLLIGSCPLLSGRVRRLFDASPAKIGRRIREIVIEPSSRLSSLSSEHVLLIPRSSSLLQMRNQLPAIGFEGQVIEV